MQRTTKGLIGVLGIWLTAGFALPMVNVLRPLSPEQLLAARGLITAFIVFLLAKGKVFRADKYTYLIGLCLPFASLGLFKGVREWGPSMTIIVITATPALTFLFSAYQKKKVEKAAVASFFLILGGVFVASYQATFMLAGFLWAVFGMIMNGLLYELFPKATSGLLQKQFWGMLGMGTLGLVLSVRSDWSIAIQDWRYMLALPAFALVHGLAYWRANITAFTYLPKNVASVLAQGETPAVILMSWVLLNESLTALQWSGVIVALYGAYHLGSWISKREDA